MNFKEILKKEELLKVLEEKNFLTPTPIQEQIMPLILEGNDVLGKSQTGTGKTLAFAGPIIEKVKEEKKTQTLILAPTRELAIQIAEEITLYAKYTSLKTVCVYGSSSIEDQIRALKKKPEIVIGTPGRVMDLLRRKVLETETIEYFVLDEADEMLSMGFQEELEFIFENLKKEKQVLLFSATMPKAIQKIAEKYMASNYKKIEIESTSKTADNIKQYFYIVNDKTRLEAMERVMDYYNPKRAIIFCRTKRNADSVLEKLENKGYLANIIHGDITQSQRIATLDRFKAGKFNYLIATDVAARGIHVEDIELVINYNLPESSEAYVHRIGRTGRAKKSGTAITFVTSREQKQISVLERHIEAPIIKKNLPTLEEVIPTYLNKMVEKLENVKDKETATNHFKKYLSTLSKDQLEAITSHLLEEKLNSKLKADYKEDLSVSSKKKSTRSSSSNDSIRVFLTIGKIDNIEKRDFLLHIEKTCDVKEGTCTDVEIMPKFTFMSIKKESYDKIVKTLNNTTYHNRRIAIEKAKK